MKKPIADLVFVSGQFVLFVLYIFELLPKLKLPFFVSVTGLFISIAGFAVSLLSVLKLDQNLTVYPTPKIDSELITTGLYKYVRHPIYAGILFFAFGFALFWSSGFKLLISIILLIWFWFKSVYEEKKLSEKYSNYKQYQHNTGRFFPKIFKR